MRGYESSERATTLPTQELRIPMRGYEAGTGLVSMTTFAVTNPHAGL